MPLDANGIHQYTEADVTSPTASGFFNLLAASVSAVIGTVLAALALRGGHLANTLNAAVTGVVATDLALTGCSITLTAGTWEVDCGISASTNGASDSVAAELWSVSTSAAVAGSTGPAGQTTVGVPMSLTSRRLTITVPTDSTVQVCPRLKRNGGSVPVAFKAASLSHPVAYIDAWRIK